MLTRLLRRNFHKVAEKVHFSQEEQTVLEFWTKIGAFQKSLQLSKGRPHYTFYDGPPFATGLPHYGHIAAGTIKDVVTRYWHQNGFYVDRRFGWDCHGLPVEFEIDKAENIRTRKQVLDLGIEQYNRKCRGIVMRYSEEWEKVVTRLGRWIDFENDYKTMDLEFMESVWWVFKEVFKKDLVYRSSRVMPYSCGCGTVLSNFEANLNYKEVRDPSVVVSFALEKGEEVLAWTTTPWTLPSNLALAVNPEFTYVKFQPLNSDKVYIVCEDLLETTLKLLKVSEHTVLEKFKGQQLEGLKYEPLFPYFESFAEKGCFQIYCADFVTKETGTGVVHCAPYGEEDFNLFVKHKLVSTESPPDALDENGKFTSLVPELEGVLFSESNKKIQKLLKEKNRLLHSGVHVHSYPYCWRSDTPLIYRPVSSWFIEVESLKQDLLKNNTKATWIPKFVQEKRFHNWLEDAKDWCFSRNRFWGNPIPLWVSEDFEEVVCVGSIEELKELTGVKEVNDLHRESIDHLTIPSKLGKGHLKRVEEVFDCWFESGSMPYAQCHYPFSVSQEEFRKRFPADFIAEGLDQTRGWFYTLLVIGTALFNQNPFKNLVVNGLVLAADGTKMSKSKGNYTDPMKIVEQLGADSIRLYLVNSPLVKAEPLKFVDQDVKNIVKEVFLPWYNAYRFFVQNAQRFELVHKQTYSFDPDSVPKAHNFMDKWIVAASQNLIKNVRHEMDNYRLYTVLPSLLGFLDNLTNWYVRLNRYRLKGETSFSDCKAALDVMFSTLLDFTVLMAPFTPFLTEKLYQNLKLGLPLDSREESVHFTMIPQFKRELIDEAIETSVSRMQTVIEVGRKLRDQKRLPLKTPLACLKVIHREDKYLDSLKPVIPYIQKELNCLEVFLEKENKNLVKLKALPNNPVLGARLGKSFNKELREAISNLSSEEVSNFESNHRIVVKGVELSKDELVIKRSYEQLGENLESGGDNDVVVVLDCTQSEDLKKLGAARELVNKVQRLRKTSGLSIQDKVQLVYEEPTHFYKSILEDYTNFLTQNLKIPLSRVPFEDYKYVAAGTVEHNCQVFSFSLYKQS